MATVAHHVYSSYDPEDREQLEVETGQLDAEADIADPWLTEKPFGTNKRITRPPMFVPATFDYNQWGSSSKQDRTVEETREEEQETECLGVWYRSLARKTPVGTPRGNTPVLQTPPQETQLPRKKPIKKNRNNWFISRVLEASASTSEDSENLRTAMGSDLPVTPSPTLADILARNPPPLPTEERYTPPVWLAIGPSNKGFAMLQKSGWEEGEALGRASRNRGGLGYQGKGKGNEVDRGDEVESAGMIKREVIDISYVDDEVVDLTALDDDDPEDVFARSEPRTQSLSNPSRDVKPPGDGMDHSPRALLTPLPTVLKADRLGIGLKAKTVGSGLYRAPVKRVTHSQAALAAHVRAGEAQRRMKKVAGRGRRGFERVKKKEEQGRRNLLAYLND